MTRCWFSVFAVFCGVLALAPPASAECAWVLWRKINPIDAPEAEWSIEAPYPTNQECENAVTSVSERFKREGWKVDYWDDWKILVGIHRVPYGPVFVEQYRCLPDTIDPRGPEG